MLVRQHPIGDEIMRPNADRPLAPAECLVTAWPAWLCSTVHDLRWPSDQVTKRPWRC